MKPNLSKNSPIAFITLILIWRANYYSPTAATFYPYVTSNLNSICTGNNELHNSESPRRLRRPDQRDYRDCEAQNSPFSRVFHIPSGQRDEAYTSALLTFYIDIGGGWGWGWRRSKQCSMADADEWRAVKHINSTLLEETFSVIILLTKKV